MRHFCYSSTSVMAALALAIAAGVSHAASPPETMDLCEYYDAVMARYPPGDSYAVIAHPGYVAEESPYPALKVRIDYPLIIGRFEVLALHFELVMGENPLDRPECDVVDDLRGSKRPAVCVSWLEAVRYANALSVRCGLEPVYDVDDVRVVWDADADGYRLPTELEWERFAQGPWGWRGWGFTHDPEEVCSAANIADLTMRERGREDEWRTTTCLDGWAATSDVGARRTTPTLPDIIGNASEWVWTPLYHRVGIADAKRADQVPGDRSAVVGKGGSWNTRAEHAAIPMRLIGDDRNYKDAEHGFRLARGPRGAVTPSWYRERPTEADRREATCDLGPRDTRSGPGLMVTVDAPTTIPLE